MVVQLYDSTGTNLLASTTTDENGNYLFGNLDVSVGGIGYRVVVAASNFKLLIEHGSAVGRTRR